MDSSSVYSSSGSPENTNNLGGEAVGCAQGPGTPSSRWKADGEPDPHGERYECERVSLAMGWMTDDELANGAFMNYDRFDMQALIAQKPGYYAPIAWMTAVKDRIRWLSRNQDALSEENKRLLDALREANHAWATLAPAALEAKKLRDALTAYADAKYCESLQRFRRDECLGLEYKLAKGKFGQAEYDAHKAANEAMGAHRGIYEVLKQFDAARSALSLPILK